jgi:hypothetical protein
VIEQFYHQFYRQLHLMVKLIVKLTKNAQRAKNVKLGGEGGCVSFLMGSAGKCREKA